VNTVIPGLGFTRIRGILLMLGEIVRLAFGGTSRIGRVYLHQWRIIAARDRYIEELTKEIRRLDALLTEHGLDTAETDGLEDAQ
jgi:hypothetical protein